MTQAVQRLSLFLTPARDDFAYADMLIRELGAKYDAPAFEPHVTVYSGPFTDVAAFRDAATVAVAGIPPLSLTVRGVGWSGEYFKSLYVEFAESPLLGRICERVREGVGDSGYRLVPHLSLIYSDMPLFRKEALARRLVIDRSEFRFDRVKIVTPRNLAAGWRDTGRWETLWSTRLA